MLRIAPDTLRADIQRFYGLNLDETGESIRVRRMADLAANLPDYALIWGKINPQAQWNATRQLLANIADNTAFLAFCKTKDASKGKKFSNTIKRPGSKTNSNSTTIKTGHAESSEELYALLGIDRERDK